MYIKLRDELANGKALFSATFEEAMQHYVAYKQREMDIDALTDGRLTTIKAHLKHFVEYKVTGNRYYRPPNAFHKMAADSPGSA